MTRNVVVTLAKARKIFADHMMCVETCLFKEKHVGAKIDGIKLLVEIEFRHVLADFGHQVLADFVHDEHSRQTHLMIIGHEILAFQRECGVVLNEDIVYVTIVIHVKNAHVAGFKIRRGIWVVIVHLAFYGIGIEVQAV